MPKIRATKRPVPDDFILKPSRIRMFLIYIVIFTVAILFGSSIRWLISRDVFSPTWLASQGPITLVIIFGGSLFMALSEYSRWTLRITGGEMLEGPSGMFGERIVISIDTIDWARTRRSLTSWLKIGNAIYDTSRQRILVSPWFFSPSHFQAMLDRLDYPA